MATDYAALKNENVKRYGTDIGRIGRMLLANRYDDRSHFIFELLQNAEDALKRRDGRGLTSVGFELLPDSPQ
jgi:HSP90 family molecular chaperone